MKTGALRDFLSSKARSLAPRLNSGFRSAVAVTLLFLTAFSVVTINGFNMYAEAEEPATNEAESQTKYKSVSDFSDARWLNIQKVVFEGIDDKATEPLEPDQLMNKKVKSGNPYFNWTDTSSLGITPDEIYNGDPHDDDKCPREIVTYIFHDADKNRDAKGGNGL